MKLKKHFLILLLATLNAHGIENFKTIKKYKLDKIAASIVSITGGVGIYYCKENESGVGFFISFLVAVLGFPVVLCIFNYYEEKYLSFLKTIEKNLRPSNLPKDIREMNDTVMQLKLDNVKCFEDLFNLIYYTLPSKADTETIKINFKAFKEEDMKFDPLILQDTRDQINRCANLCNIILTVKTKSEAKDIISFEVILINNRSLQTLTVYDLLQRIENKENKLESHAWTKQGTLYINPNIWKDLNTNRQEFLLRRVFGKIMLNQHFNHTVNYYENLQAALYFDFFKSSSGKNEASILPFILQDKNTNADQSNQEPSKEVLNYALRKYQTLVNDPNKIIGKNS